MKVLAEIEIDASPQEEQHAQHILDQWTKFNPLEIKIVEVMHSQQ